MHLRAPGPALVGGFVLGGLVLVVAGILFFGGTAIFSRTTRAVVYFEGSVGGLTVGAPVTFRGLQIGSVASVSLVIDVHDMKARIPVYLTLDPTQVRLTGGPAGRENVPPLRQFIEAGLDAKLVAQSFVTGQMDVELDLSPNRPTQPVQEGPGGVLVIPTVPSEFAALQQQIVHAPIADTVTQALHTLAAVEKVANKIDRDVDPLVANITLTLAQARDAIDTGRDSIVRVQRDASAMFDEGAGLARDGRAQLAGRGAQLSKALSEAEQALHSADLLFIYADSLLAPRSRERDDVDSALRDLANTISSLRSFAQALNRDPSILLHGRGGP